MHFSKIDSHAERVGATLVVALNQGGGKPCPYDVGIHNGGCSIRENCHQ